MGFDIGGIGKMLTGGLGGLVGGGLEALGLGKIAPFAKLGVNALTGNWAGVAQDVFGLVGKFAGGDFLGKAAKNPPLGGFDQQNQQGDFAGNGGQQANGGLDINKLGELIAGLGQMLLKALEGNQQADGTQQADPTQQANGAGQDNNALQQADQGNEAGQANDANALQQGQDVGDNNAAGNNQEGLGLDKIIDALKTILDFIKNSGMLNQKMGQQQIAA
jgi:hypothetical protein